MCNLSRYLEEKEIECRRIGYSHVANSQAQIEWTDLALKLQRLNLDHVDRCPICQAAAPDAVSLLEALHG